MPCRDRRVGTAAGLGLPLGGGQDNAGFPLGAGEGVLGKGDRVPKFEAGFTAPGPDRIGPVVHFGDLAAGVAYLLDHAAAGRTARHADQGRAVDRRVAHRQVSEPWSRPRSNTMRMPFPDLPLESHSGTVKWVAPIQLAAGGQARDGQDRRQGQHATLRCQGVRAAEGLSVCRPCCGPTCKPVAVAAPQGPKETRASPPRCLAAADRPATASRPRPAIQPCRQTGSAANPVSRRNGQGRGRGAGRRDRLAAVHQRRRAWRKWSARGFDLEQIRENVRKEAMPAWGSSARSSLGFLGGLILNIMPCVLPVIGLKILSFVEQAGHNRRKAFMLNVWYSAGLLAVFFILASLAVGPQHLGWGELFGKAWFTITLTAVVFVMALSFMGVWEVPLPTFLGSGKAGELAAQEGAVGAFFKGVLTTFLATPCSAPILAPALVWATAQPAWLTYAVFPFRGPGHGQSVPAGRRVSRIVAIPAQARRVDGDLQDTSWASCSWARWSISWRCWSRSMSCRPWGCCSASRSCAGGSAGSRPWRTSWPSSAPGPRGPRSCA